MANKPIASNTSAAKPSIEGAVAIAPIGTTLPTTATAALDAAFTRLGYLTEDGLVNSTGMSTTGIKAWGGDTVLNVMTEKTDTWKFSLMEVLDPAVLKAVHGDDNVTGTLEAGLAVKANSLELEPKVYVFDILMNGGVLKRVVIPVGTITALDDVTYKSDTAVAYGVTVGATPDENGQTHYEYIAKKGAVTNGD